MTLGWLLVFVLLPGISWAADIDRFLGTYTGEAEFVFDGKPEHRDMSVTIESAGKGFSVTWTSVSTRSDGRKKTKTYTVEFRPSDRPHIFGAATKMNVFGKKVPLNPLAGEPYVWARVDGDTFTVFSLYINEVGEYEMQEYHRTLADGGLDLVFRSVSPGGLEKVIEAFLKREG